MHKLLTTAALAALVGVISTSAMATEFVTPKQWAKDNCYAYGVDSKGNPKVFVIGQSGADISESDRVVIGSSLASSYVEGRYLFPYGNNTPNFVFRLGGSGEGYAPTTYQPYRERPERCDIIGGVAPEEPVE